MISSLSALPGVVARLRARWWWQPDKWERLTTVLRLADAGPDARVADVGGRGRELRGLLPGRSVVSVNVEEPCDLLVGPGPLPLPDAAYDVVTSTDVLEHVPPGDRDAHVAELVRIARRRVVLCFPCWSTTKADSERRTAARLADEYGVRFDFLDEHLEHGLPKAQDVVAAALAASPEATVRLSFSDGVLAAEDLLVDAVRAVKGHQPMAVLRCARAWLFRRRPVLTTQVSEDNSRAYVVIDLAR